VNSGSTVDSLLSVTVPFGGTTLTATGASIAPSTLQPNTTTTVVATFTGTMPSAGQQVTLTATTAAGQSYTFSTTVVS
jgi:hypothetical protein